MLGANAEPFSKIVAPIPEFLELLRRLFNFGGAALPAAEQIDGCAEFQQGIGGRLDSVYAGNGIEDDVLLLSGGVGHNRGEFDDAEVGDFAGFGPVDGGVVCRVFGSGDLDCDREADGAGGDAVGDFGEVVVGRDGCNLLGGEKVIAELREDAVTAEFGLAGSICEGEAVTPSIREAILRCVPIETSDTSVAFGGKQNKTFPGFDNGANGKTTRPSAATRTVTVGADAATDGGATAVDASGPLKTASCAVLACRTATVLGVAAVPVVAAAMVTDAVAVVASAEATGNEAERGAALPRLFPKTTRPLRPTTSTPALGKA